MQNIHPETQTLMRLVAQGQYQEAAALAQAAQELFTAIKTTEIPIRNH